MDSKQKAAFVKACGKGRKKFYRGGPVRKNYDGGGLVNLNAVNPNTGVIGTIGNALGLNDQFQAGTANITPGTNIGQLNTAYGQAQDALGNANTLASSTLGAVPGAVNNQNTLAAQELAMSQGLGPNPAMAQLAQTTGTNIASQAALEAGQRGAAGNVGLMARNIGQQGGSINQQAVGQGATMEAQQQINAQNNLANLTGNQINQAGSSVGTQNSAVQNEQSTLQNANTAANNAAVGMQSNINSTNAATAAGNQGMAGKILGGLSSATSGILGGLGLAEGGMVEKDHHIALAEMNSASLAHAKKNFAGGGPVTNWFNNASENNNTSTGMEPSSGASSAPTGAGDNAGAYQLGTSVGKGLNSLFGNNGASPEQSDSDAAAGYKNADALIGPATDATESILPAIEDLAVLAAHGGMMGKPCEGPHLGHVANYLNGGDVKAMVSEDEIYLNPSQVKDVVDGKKDPKKIGTIFKARSSSEKATVKGDSLKNDKIPADLQSGGVVIDRKHVGTPEKRAAFVRKTVAKKKAGRK